MAVTTKRRKRASPAPSTLEELKAYFYKNVAKATPSGRSHQRGCWLWTGRIRRDGWPVFELGDEIYSARRAAYEFEHGSLEDGLKLKNTCRLRRCVNPAHLTAVPRDTKTTLELEAQKVATMEPMPGTPKFVTAHERRSLGDPIQKSWDACDKPGDMLRALMRAPDFGAPAGPARWNLELQRMLKEKVRGAGRMGDQLALSNSLLLTARLLRDGDAEQAITLLSPVVLRMGMPVRALPPGIADVVRGIYPLAPPTWREGAPPESR